MQKRDFFLVVSVAVLIFAIFSFQKTQAPSIIQTTANSTTPQTPVSYDFSKVNWLSWLITAGVVVWVLWKQNQEKRGQPYKDTMEAVKDLEARAKSHGIFPIAVEQQDFSDRDSKMEFIGTFKCKNVQFPYGSRPIPFAIRKNGVFKFDLTKLYHPEMQEKKTIEIQNKKKEGKK